MKSIIIASKVMTITLFVLLGCSIIFLFKNVVEHVGGKIANTSSMQKQEIEEFIGGGEGGFGEEVLRVVRKMNDLPEKWIPGRQRGKAVKIYYNLPVKIRLQ